MKIIHTADWHLSSNKTQQLKARHSLDQLLGFCSSVDIDGIIIAGDVWDRIQPYGNDSGIILAYEYLRNLSRLVKFIFIIKGNPTHDAYQSIELLHQLEKNIYSCEKNISLGINLKSDGRFTNLFTARKNSSYDLLLHGISYPTKANLLEGKSIDMQNFNFVEKFSEVMELHGLISDEFSLTPNITTFHGNVSGAKLSNGQTLLGQDILIPSSILEKTKSNYYCLGHIHLGQNIKSNMRYSGSIYNKDFGETETKYFDVIEINYPEIIVTSQPFISNRPMVIVEAEFRNGIFIYEKNFPKNAEIKLKYNVKENERDLVTADQINNLRLELGTDIRIESRIIPSERISRSLNIMKAKSLLEEVIEYSKIIGEEISESIKEKVLKIEIDNYNGEK